MRDIRARLVFTIESSYHPIVEGIWEIVKDHKNVFAPLTSDTVISNKLKTIYKNFLHSDYTDLFRRALRRLGCIDRLDAPEPDILRIQFLHLITTKILQHTETGSESYQQAIEQKAILENLMSMMDSCKQKKLGVGACAGFLTFLLGMVGTGAWLIIAEPDEDKHDGAKNQIFGAVFCAVSGIASLVSTGFMLRKIQSIKAITREKDTLLTQLHAYTLEPEAKVSYHVKYVSPTSHTIAYQNVLRIMDSILENQQNLACHICYQTEQPQDEIADAIEIVVQEVKSTSLLTAVDSKDKDGRQKDSELPRELSYALTTTHNLGGPYHAPCIHSHLVQQQSLVVAEALEEKSSIVKDPATNEPLLLDSIGRVQLILKDEISGQWKKMRTTYPRLFQPATASITGTTTLPTKVTQSASTTTTATTTTGAASTTATTTTTSTTTSSPSIISTVTSAMSRGLRQNWLTRTVLKRSASAVDPALNINESVKYKPPGYQLLSGGPR